MMSFAVTYLTKRKVRTKYFDKDGYPGIASFEMQPPIPIEAERIPLDGENIPPSRVGTMVDLITRAYIVHNRNAFLPAKNGWEIYKEKYAEKLGIKTDRVFTDAVNTVNRAINADLSIDELPNSFFDYIEELAELEDISRGQRVYKPEIKRNNQTTIDHIREMLHRVCKFFDAYGMPVQSDYRVVSRGNTIHGDCDYLTKTHLIDFKVSNGDQRKDPSHRLQIALYLVLGKEMERDLGDHTFENINDLILYNPRSGKAAIASGKEILSSLKSIARKTVVPLEQGQNLDYRKKK